jgi:hypothetical protein
MQGPDVRSVHIVISDSEDIRGTINKLTSLPAVWDTSWRLQNRGLLVRLRLLRGGERPFKCDFRLKKEPDKF